MNLFWVEPKIRALYAQRNTTQHNTTQHNTTQRNATQRNATQRNTTQHKLSHQWNFISFATLSKKL